MNLAALIKGKTWNAEPDSLNGKPATAFYGKFKNFLDSSKSWERINCVLSPTGTGFEMTQAPMMLHAPKRSIDYAEIVANSRFDLFASPGNPLGKTLITEDSFGPRIRPIDVDDVAGELYDINTHKTESEGGGRLDSVIYKNAWNTGSFAAHLVYQSEHGIAVRQNEYIVFDKKPSGSLTGFIPIQFEVEFAFNGEVSRAHKVEMSPRVITSGRDRASERDYWENELKKPDSKLTLAEQSQGLYLRLQDSTGKRGCGTRPSFIQDNSRNSDGLPKRWFVETHVERTGMNRYRFTKLIPKSFFIDAVFPVISNFTFTGNPDAHPGTNTSDSYSRPFPDFDWDTVHDSPTGDGNKSSFSQNISMGVSHEVGRGGFRIFRANAYIDTGSLSAGALITDAVFSVDFSTINNGDNDGVDFVSVVQVQGDQIGSDTDIGDNDFPHCGDAVDNPAEGSNRVSLANLNLNQYNPFAFNGSGIGWVARNGEQKPIGGTAGITYLGIREGHDQLDHPLASLTSNLMSFDSAEHPSGQVPKLVVGWSLGLAASIKNIGFDPIQQYGLGTR